MKSRGADRVKGWIVRSGVNPACVFCEDGEWHSLVGPGGWAAKIYKTRHGAEARAHRRAAGDTVHAVDAAGREMGHFGVKVSS